jgi:hypothetical protein
MKILRPVRSWTTTFQGADAKGWGRLGSTGEVFDFGDDWAYTDPSVEHELTHGCALHASHLRLTSSYW